MEDVAWRRSEWSGGRTWRTQEYEPPRTWDTSEEIFIPEFLAGFLLLQRAGLDTQEKANILAAFRGEFSTLSVGRALREQWSDEDLSRRDKAKMSTAYYTAADEEEDEAPSWSTTTSRTGTSTTTAYLAEQERAEEEMMVIKAQKATLKEARWKQKQLKLGRQFYPPKGMPKGSSGSSGGGGGKGS